MLIVPTSDEWREMGKATELYDDLSKRPVSPAESRRRRVAAEIGDGNDLRRGPDGTITKQTRPAETPREVVQLPYETRD